MDIDLCGPSLPRMLGVEDKKLQQTSTGWKPVMVQQNLQVLSIGFMLKNKTDAVIFRGPMKNNYIK